jgi:hypothetical protein
MVRSFHNPNPRPRFSVYSPCAGTRSGHCHRWSWRLRRHCKTNESLTSVTPGPNRVQAHRRPSAHVRADMACHRWARVYLQGQRVDAPILKHFVWAPTTYFKQINLLQRNAPRPGLQHTGGRAGWDAPSCPGQTAKVCNLPQSPQNSKHAPQQPPTTRERRTLIRTMQKPNPLLMVSSLTALEGMAMGCKLPLGSISGQKSRQAASARA